MAFFNLTLLGAQEPIKSSLRSPEAPDYSKSPRGQRDQLRLTTPISRVTTDSSGQQSPVAVAQAQTVALTATVPSQRSPVAMAAQQRPVAVAQTQTPMEPSPVATPTLVTTVPSTQKNPVAMAAQWRPVAVAQTPSPVATPTLITTVPSTQKSPVAMAAQRRPVAVAQPPLALTTTVPAAGRPTANNPLTRTGTPTAPAYSELTDIMSCHVP